MKVITMSLMLVICLIPCLPVQAQDTQGDAAPAARNSDPVRYTRGLRLYQKNCAACHGRQGEGDPNWRQRDAQGKFLPPPLNGTGHTWHHPMAVLLDIILNGTARLGGNMPAWKGRLGEREIGDILYWVQSQWSDEIYRQWFENDRVVREEMRHN